MKTLMKYTAAMALTGALALAAATPSEARNGRNAAAIGFGVGAVAGAAIAGSAYNGGYYGYSEPGYAYAPDYGYDSLRVRFIRIRARAALPLLSQLVGRAQYEQLLDPLSALTGRCIDQGAALQGGFFFKVAPDGRARPEG